MSLYGDLLGVPWEKDGRDLSGMDCAGICIEYLRRLGIETPESAWTIRLDWQGAPVVKDCWEKLGDGYTDATEPGDIIVSAHETDTGTSDHVSVVVNAGEFAALTTTSKEGVGAFICKSYAIRNVVGAYRYKG